MKRDAHEKYRLAAEALQRASAAAYRATGSVTKPICHSHLAAAEAELQCALDLIAAAKSPIPGDQNEEPH